MARGRPENRGGKRRKEALMTAWDKAGKLTTASVAEAAGVPIGTFYSYLNDSAKNQPTGEALGAIATEFERHAKELVDEAAWLRVVARESEAKAPPPARRLAKAKKPRRSGPAR